MDYQPGALHLLKTTDGRSFQHVSELKIDGGPNESTIRFDKNGKMYVVIRRDGADKVGAIATSNEPYTNWTFSKIGERIGGPEFFFLNDSTLCIASRLYIKNPPGAEKEYKGYKTALFFTDLSGKIKKTIPFEQSGGDNSYPGLVSYKNKLWVSYYSSHEGKTSIYLAKVPMQMLE